MTVWFSTLLVGACESCGDIAMSFSRTDAAMDADQRTEV